MKRSGLAKSARKPFTARDFYVLLVLVLSFNMLLWLDSFDRYLSSRYHFYLSQYVPESAYAPSRGMQQAFQLNRDSDELAADDDSGGAGGAVPGAAIPAPAAPSVAAASAPASVMPESGVQGNATPGDAMAVAASAHGSTVPEGMAMAAVSTPVQVRAVSAPAAAARLAAVDGVPRILFAGDSMMQGVAPIVISRMRHAYPHGVFVDASKESTGLTVKRYFDWPTKIKEECVSQGLHTVVIFLGPNDPWDIYEHRHRYIFPSDKWEQKYRSRVDEVLDFATAKGLRVIWIGLPVMREDRIEQGAKIENRIFEEETKKYKFEYMATGDMLGSVEEPYKKYIEDPEKGKIVVRADDGVHFTSKGLRMISSRVEALLKKQDKL